MNYYLLAFPRSGSSLTRSVISYITGMVPRQPQGHCELDHICKKFYIKNHTDKFFKFHFPKDENHYVECRENNKLILLLRNKYENILSYLFSDYHQQENINNTKLDIDYYKQFIEKTTQSTDTLALLKKWSTLYKNNINYYNTWRYEKMILSYEEIVSNPINYLFDQIQNDPNNVIPFYRKSSSQSFVDIFSSVLKFKKSTNDPLKINTEGKDLYKFYKIMTPEIKTIIDTIIDYE